MVGVEGRSPGSLARVFDLEGVPRPRGQSVGIARSSGSAFSTDVYKPHTFEEVSESVSAEVAARLDPEKRYGSWWFNRRRT